MASVHYPTYGELIDLLELHPDAHSLQECFNDLYPHITVPRADRFYKTVERLAGPTKSSKAQIDLGEYRRRIWKPRVRNEPGTDPPKFPEYLLKFGLDETLLVRLLDGCEPDLSWEIPDSCSSDAFYSELHHFLKIWPKSRSYTKTALGTFYSRIDPFLKQRNFRPDNAYRYVERMVNRFTPKTEKKCDALKESKISIDHNSFDVDSSHLDRFEQPHFDDWPNTGSAQEPLHNSSCTPECWQECDEECASTTELSTKAFVSYKPRNVDRREKRKQIKIKTLQERVREGEVKSQKLERLVKKKEKETSHLQKRLDSIAAELKKVSRMVEETERERDNAKRKADKAEVAYASLLSDFIASEDFIETLQDDFEDGDTSEEFGEDDTNESESSDEKFSLQTKCGRHYSLAVRRLYYTLLSNQVPASTITDIIKAVVNCFLPDVDVSTLKLPKERCAGYLRREEMTTIGMAHKAHVLCEQDQQFHLNSDGTTLQQRKLNGLALNGVVVSVNEVSDGSAETVVNDIEKELAKLRRTAHLLKLPNADAINWTLFASSTSDSASTQKKLNRLIQERKEADEQKYGPIREGGVGLIQNFCAMHLGVNLRKAFIQSISPVDEQADEHTQQGTSDKEQSQQRASTRTYEPVNTFVHEFVKEFGSCGTPEYAAGSVQFPDFLELQSTSCENNSDYYKKCCDVHLERQVGSRYFVTAANASRALFLAPAAFEYLKFSGVSATTGNKLERSLYSKLREPSLLASLKADALMFYFVYADLVSLAKSSELNKSAYDMGQHYAELKTYLEKVEKYPKVTASKDYKVFSSEPRLYGESRKLNHRLRNQQVWSRLFSEDKFDDIVFRLLSTGAAAMNEKLSTYASSQLPGGEYWEPDSATKSVLSTIKPTNDLVESILGLNDYLSTAIPNMDQSTKSSMVTVKKNKTMKWMKNLPEDQQDRLTVFAMQQRPEVFKSQREEKSVVRHKRQELMLQAKKRRDLLAEKARVEREKLSTVHVITTVSELEQVFAAIDDINESTNRKCKKKLAILKEQVRVRKKVLNQKVNIKFTQSRKNRPLGELIKELKEVIISNADCTVNTTSTTTTTVEKNPLSLVGTHVSHKFVDENSGEETWYEGFVLGYNSATKMHEVAYVEEENNFYFNLMEDLEVGDLEIIDD